MRWKLPLNKRGIKNKKIEETIRGESSKREAEVSILSAVYDSGTTSSYVIHNNEFILTNEQ